MEAGGRGGEACREGGYCCCGIDDEMWILGRSGLEVLEGKRSFWLLEKGTLAGGRELGGEKELCRVGLPTACGERTARGLRWHIRDVLVLCLQLFA